MFIGGLMLVAVALVFVYLQTVKSQSDNDVQMSEFVLQTRNMIDPAPAFIDEMK